MSKLRQFITKYPRLLNSAILGVGLIPCLVKCVVEENAAGSIGFLLAIFTQFELLHSTWKFEKLLQLSQEIHDNNAKLLDANSQLIELSHERGRFVFKMASKVTSN